MRTKQLTPTREDYIRAIYILNNRLGKQVRVKDLTEYLHLSKSTISERLRELARNHLIVAAPYGSVTLTKRGMEAAKALTYKHRVIEVFLFQILHIPREQLHEEANKLEHGVSDMVLTKLARHVGYPRIDPHGVAIVTE